MFHKVNNNFSETFSSKFSITKASFVLNLKKIFSFNSLELTCKEEVLFFKIYYYGNPKKLRSELSKFGYMLMNNQGVWHLILNE